MAYRVVFSKNNAHDMLRLAQGALSTMPNVIFTFPDILFEI